MVMLTALMVAARINFTGQKGAFALCLNPKRSGYTAAVEGIQGDNYRCEEWTIKMHLTV